MVWKYTEGDKYELYQLEGFKKFFEQDLIYAQAQLVHTMSFQRYGLPGWRFMKIAADMAVANSEKNLSIVNEAIKDIS